MRKTFSAVLNSTWTSLCNSVWHSLWEAWKEKIEEVFFRRWVREYRLCEKLSRVFLISNDTHCDGSQSILVASLSSLQPDETASITTWCWYNPPHRSFDLVVARRSCRVSSAECTISNMFQWKAARKYLHSADFLDII